MPAAPCHAPATWTAAGLDWGCLSGVCLREHACRPSAANAIWRVCSWRWSPSGSCTRPCRSRPARLPCWTRSSAAWACRSAQRLRWPNHAPRIPAQAAARCCPGQPGLARCRPVPGPRWPALPATHTHTHALTQPLAAQVGPKVTAHPERRVALRAVMRAWLPLSSCLLDMVVARHACAPPCPLPRRAQPRAPSYVRAAACLPSMLDSSSISRALHWPQAGLSHQQSPCPGPQASPAGDVAECSSRMCAQAAGPAGGCARAPATAAGAPRPGPAQQRGCSGACPAFLPRLACSAARVHPGDVN